MKTSETYERRQHRLRYEPKSKHRRCLTPGKIYDALDHKNPDIWAKVINDSGNVQKYPIRHFEVVSSSSVSSVGLREEGDFWEALEAF